MRVRYHRVCPLTVVVRSGVQSRSVSPEGPRSAVHRPSSDTSDLFQRNFFTTTPPRDTRLVLRGLLTVWTSEDVSDRSSSRPVWVLDLTRVGPTRETHLPCVSLSSDQPCLPRTFSSDVSSPVGSGDQIRTVAEVLLYIRGSLLRGTGHVRRIIHRLRPTLVS